MATDLVIGVLVSNPDGCYRGGGTNGSSCDMRPVFDGALRWAYSVRRHTAPDTQIVLLTERSSFKAVQSFARRLEAQLGVQLVQGDFMDNAERVEHDGTGGSRFVWCPMRNRWFVIRDFLRQRMISRQPEYRHVLMSDVRDVIVQRDPFANASLLAGTVIFSGEGRTLRHSRKGLPRTVTCARELGADPDTLKWLQTTEPMNAGVTLAGGRAYRQFVEAFTLLLTKVTTPPCLAVRDCTDQGPYNLLAHWLWNASEHLAHTRRLLLPIERALSYTVSKVRGCCRLDEASGRVLNGEGVAPALIHQYSLGSSAKALSLSSRFGEAHLRLPDGVSTSHALPRATPRASPRAS